MVAFRVLMLLGSLAIAGPISAQSYPAKPIRLIVPFPPGGGTDITARMVGQPLSEKLGQPVVIDHRPGAGTMLGTELAAKAAPDGHTLILVAAPHAINPAMYRSVKYDPVRDFAPIALAISFPYIVAVHPAIQARSIKELIALAKSGSPVLTFASSGTGVTNHLAGELFKRMAGVEMTHVPYKGGGPALNDVIGGHVSMIFGTILETMPQVRNGRVRGLAVTSSKRVSFAPDLATVSEDGLPGYDVTGWYAVLAPAGTPANIVARLNEETTRILGSAAVKDRFLAMGAEPWPTSSDKAREFIAAETARWGKIVKAAGITAN